MQALLCRSAQGQADLHRQKHLREEDRCVFDHGPGIIVDQASLSELKQYVVRRKARSAIRQQQALYHRLMYGTDFEFSPPC